MMAVDSRTVLRLFLLIFCARLAASQRFRPPDRNACANRRVHYSAFGKRYHFSWLDAGRTAKFTWAAARNYCRRFCMDSLSIDSSLEYDTIKRIIRHEKLDYIWTSGRKCNFLPACGRVDLQPAIINGWFWANTGTRLPPPEKCEICDWSDKGGLDQAQPDNREFRTKFGGEEEACIAILNDFYQDGVRWHDVGCSHRKPVICQEMGQLLREANAV